MAVPGMAAIIANANNDVRPNFMIALLPFYASAAPSRLVHQLEARSLPIAERLGLYLIFLVNDVTKTTVNVK